MKSADLMLTDGNKIKFRLAKPTALEGSSVDTQLSRNIYTLNGL